MEDRRIAKTKGALRDAFVTLLRLSFGQTFGFQNPIVLDLGVMIITFGLTIKITIASILGIIIAAIIYHFI